MNMILRMLFSGTTRPNCGGGGSTCGHRRSRLTRDTREMKLFDDFHRAFIKMMYCRRTSRPRTCRGLGQSLFDRGENHDYRHA